MTRIFPTLEEILAIHQLLISEFGGVPGLRDIGALESALMRPQLGYYQNLFQEAAALMESMANNHPFVDGNKRMAFFAADTFLRMNGYYIDSENAQAYDYFMMLFRSNTFRYQCLLPWIREHSRPLPQH